MGADRARARVSEPITGKLNKHFRNGHLIRKNPFGSGGRQGLVVSWDVHETPDFVRRSAKGVVDSLTGRTPGSARANIRYAGVFVVEKVDTFLGFVSLTDNRAVIVYLNEHGGRRYVKLSTFAKNRGKGYWYLTKQFYMMPIECAA